MSRRQRILILVNIIRIILKLPCDFGDLRKIVENMKDYIEGHLNPFREKVQHLVKVSSGFHTTKVNKNNQMKALQLGDIFSLKL